jgi:hypothetical protein
MKNQNEMYKWLKEHVTSHTFEQRNNLIVAKRKYKTQGFSSFIITYLKNENAISFKCTSFKSNTRKFVDDKDFVCQLGSVAYFE